MTRDPKPHGRRTVFPYYKVQRFDDRLMTWRDARKEAFDTLPEAKSYLATLEPNVKSRIVEVTRGGQSVLGASKN